MADKAYSADEVAVTLAGLRVVGLGEGDDAIMAEWRSDVTTISVGADGNGVASRSADRSGTVKIKLQHDSELHKSLVRIHNARSTASVGDFDMTVTATGEGIAANDLFIAKPPSVSIGAKATERVWEFVTADLRYRAGE